jgi:hypothetical protein
MPLREVTGKEGERKVDDRLHEIGGIDGFARCRW